MIHWRNCLASAVPKLAVIAHDLIQVWVCWVALHAARYSMLVHPGFAVCRLAHPGCSHCASGCFLASRSISRFMAFCKRP